MKKIKSKINWPSTFLFRLTNFPVTWAYQMKWRMRLIITSAIFRKLLSFIDIFMQVAFLIILIFFAQFLLMSNVFFNTSNF